MLAEECSEQKYSDLPLFLTSGGGGLETADTAATFADSGVAPSGLHIGLSC